MRLWRNVVAIASGFVTRQRARSIDGRDPSTAWGVGRMSLAPQRQFDSPPDLRAANTAARQHGMIRIDQLVACGLDGAAVARRVRKGWLHRVHRGVYAVGYIPDTLDAHFQAAVLTGDVGAFLSHWASCALAGLVRWDGRPVDVTLRGTSVRKVDGDRISPLAHGPAARHHASPRDPLHDGRPRAARGRPAAVRPAPEARGPSGTGRTAGERGPDRRRPAPRQRPPRRGKDRGDHRHRPRADRQQPRGHRARPHPGCRARASGRQRAARRRWRALLPRPPLAGPAPQPRDRQQPLARRPARSELDADRQADLEAAGERVLRTSRDQALRAPQQLVARLLAAGAPRARHEPLPPAQPSEMPSLVQPSAGSTSPASGRPYQRPLGIASTSCHMTSG